MGRSVNVSYRNPWGRVEGVGGFVLVDILGEGGQLW